ncbi:MAG TPA: GlsB/YeaQ/YmgE family stress response membrane protein [Lysobacter sp.]
MEALLGSTNWLYVILIGLVVGVLARLLKPGRDNMGIILTIVVGIAGAMLASFVGQRMGWYAPGQAAGFIGALLGAIVILVIVALFRGQGRRRLR